MPKFDSVRKNLECPCFKFDNFKVTPGRSHFSFICMDVKQKCYLLKYVIVILPQLKCTFGNSSIHVVRLYLFDSWVNVSGDHKFPKFEKRNCCIVLPICNACITIGLRPNGRHALKVSQN